VSEAVPARRWMGAGWLPKAGTARTREGVGGGGGAGGGGGGGGPPRGGARGGGGGGGAAPQHGRITLDETNGLDSWMAERQKAGYH
jgi:hypothetical protein